MPETYNVFAIESDGPTSQTRCYVTWVYASGATENIGVVVDPTWSERDLHDAIIARGRAGRDPGVGIADRFMDMVGKTYDVAPPKPVEDPTPAEVVA